eukprot:NODE_6_length_48303_cov_0.387022.p21 type:complete len:127 gc:universal NODE_6_length_48303_cov_0.387022:33842-34222(+)
MSFVTIDCSNSLIFSLFSKSVFSTVCFAFLLSFSTLDTIFCSKRDLDLLAFDMFRDKSDTSCLTYSSCSSCLHLTRLLNSSKRLRIASVRSCMITILLAVTSASTSAFPDGLFSNLMLRCFGLREG